MTDYQKLVDFFMDELPEDNPWVGNVKSLVEKLIANGVTFATENNVSGKWIPVTERLPECYQVVLCYKAGRGVRIGKHLNAIYTDKVAAFKDYYMDYVFGATHWMPFPRPPKGE